MPPTTSPSPFSSKIPSLNSPPICTDPMSFIRTGTPYLSDEAKAFIRTPAGHPEGYLEAFANIYRAFTNAVRDYKPGKRINPEKYDFPDVEDGVRGMNFVTTAVKSANSNKKWITLK